MTMLDKTGILGWPTANPHLSGNSFLWGTTPLVLSVHMVQRG